MMKQLDLSILRLDLRILYYRLGVWQNVIAHRVIKKAANIVETLIRLDAS